MLDKLGENTLIKLLEEMGTQQLTSRLYNAIAPRLALTAIETVILRRRNGKCEILLARRSSDDAYYQNQWHSPGTMLRASDVDPETETGFRVPEYDGFKKAFDRLTKGELGVKFKCPPIQIKSLFHLTPRGPEVALIFLCEIYGEPLNGKFFDIKELPKNLIDHHYRIIETVKEYLDKE